MALAEPPPEGCLCTGITMPMVTTIFIAPSTDMSVSRTCDSGT